MADPYAGGEILYAPARRNDPYAGGEIIGAPLFQQMAPEVVKSISDSIISGFEDSGFTRLMRGGKGPSKELPADAPWYYRAGRGVGSLGGDFIPSVAGAIAATPTGPIGMMAAGMAAPMALREAVVQAYSGSHAADINGVLEIGKAAFKEGTKGAIIGAATGGVGRALAPALGATVKGATVLTAAEIGTMTTVSSALEGKVPTWQDFMDNAILLGGVKAAVGTSKTLLRVWAETGRTPEQVRGDAARDPKLAEDLLRRNETVGEKWTATEAEAQGYTVKAYRGVDLDKPFNDTGTAWFSTSKDVAEAYAREVWSYDNPGVLEVRINPRDLARYDIRKLTVEESIRLGGDGDALAPQALGIYINADDSPIHGARHTTIHTPVENVWMPGKGVLRGASKLPAAYEPVALDQRIQAALAQDPRPEIVSKILTDPNWKPTADQPPPVKTDYLTDRASLAGVAGEVQRVYAKEIEAATRGTRSNQATLAEAMEIYGKGIEPKKIGTAAAAEEVMARAMIAKSAKIEALRAEEAHLANPADVSAQLKWLHSIEVIAATERDFRAVQAEWGRAGQAMRRIKYDPNFLPEVTAILDKYQSGKTPIGELMVAFRALNDPHKQAAFARELAKPATTFEKFTAAWRAGIFSGPLTWQANILGNTGKWAMDVIEKPVAALFEAGLSKDPLTMTQFKARALSPWVGLQLAVMDGMKQVGETNRLIEQHGVRKGLSLAKEAYDARTSGFESKVDVHGETLRTDAPSAIERAAAHFKNFSFGALKLQDLPFRTVGERMKAYEMAVDRVTKETDLHPSTSEWKAAVMKFVEDPTFGLSEKKAFEVRAAIEKAGDAQVFSEALGPKMAQASAAISGTPLELLFPARKTPVNLLSWAAQHTPILNFLSPRWNADFAAGGAQRAQALARVTVGGVLAGTAFMLADQGLFTGGNLADPEANAAKEGAREQKYSIKTPDGEYLSIARFEPIAKPIMLIADLVEIAKSPNLKEEDRGKAIALMTLALANSTISTTYLSGLSSFFRAALEPGRWGEILMESYATTLVPKIIGQPTTMADPYKREVDGVFDAIQSQIPFLREQLVAKRDVWGAQVENERVFGFMPIQSTKASEDKVKTEASRLYLGIVRAPEYVYEKSPLKPSEERTKLTTEQRSVMQEVSGGFALEVLSGIVNQPGWDKLPDFAQRDIYRNVLKQAKAVGAYKALPADSPERAARRERVWNEMRRQIGEAESR